MASTTAPSTTTAPLLRPQPPTAPPAPAPQRAVVITGLLLAAALDAYVAASVGARQAVLLALGLGLGLTLFHSRFGFASAWRQLVAVGQGAPLRAHLLLLGATAVLFAPVLAAGSGLGVPVSGAVAPVGVSVALGALLFGLGMQVGGACASGTLYAVGSGQSAILFTLGGFVVGATIGAWHMGFWAQTPSFGPISLADRFGYPAALALTLLVLAAIWVVSRLVQARRTPPPVAPVATARGPARAVRGSWPMWVGAVMLAVLGLAVLVVSGGPWGITSAFSLWGSKLAGLAGADPASWAFWSGHRAGVLAGPVLADTTTLTDLGIILGALVASGLAGAFTLHQHIPWRTAVAGIVGGVLMGYGARLAYGCNIGAYLGGIGSFSLHGWLWAVMALVGTWLGLRVRPLFGLANPKPSDGVC